jgi:hypothetical protein
MPELPLYFLCSISGPNKELHQRRVWSYENGLDVKKKFSEMSGYATEDLKVLFGNHEMLDTEKLEDLVPLGFTKESQLSVEFINPMKIFVQTDDGKEYSVLLTPKCRLEHVVIAVCPQMKLPFGLGEISIGGCKCDEYRTLNEMDISEGSILKFALCPLGEMILKKESINESIIEKAISSVKTIPFTQLKRNITTGFLSDLKRMMDCSREKREITCLLKRFILSIALRESASCDISD